jgi:dihydroneopterin aldolase
MLKQLNITGYEIFVTIGNEDFERREKQKIIIDVRLRFAGKNGACGSDDLSETVCYAALVDFIRKKLKDTEFHLMERLTQFLYDEITEYLKKKLPDVIVLTYVEVIKAAPPVENLKNASFICADWQ